MPRQRIVSKREPNKRILILCEGKKTEPYYFNGIKREKSASKRRAALKIVIYDVPKNTGKELVNEAVLLKREAIQQKNPFDDIWIVIDKDGYTKHPQAFNRANSHNINIAFSSISFEFWILLHFIYTTRSFSNSDELISFLKKNCIEDYEKSADNYSKISHLTPNAIKNAQSVRKYFQTELNRGTKIYQLNPYTDVDILVDRLIKL